MRLKSAGVSGFASESRVEAAWRCALLIDSNRLQSCFDDLAAVVFVVFSAFMRFGSSGRYHANGLTPHRVSDTMSKAQRHAASTRDSDAKPLTPADFKRMKRTPQVKLPCTQVARQP